MTLLTQQATCQVSQMSRRMQNGIFLLVVSFLLAFTQAVTAAVISSGPFAISNITTTTASSCTAADASITLTIDAGSPGTAPYDVSLDNGATWVANNLTPNGAREIAVSNQTWGNYALAVRDASNAIIYPGYAEITGCTIDVGAFSNPSYSIDAVSGATGYIWTTTVGAITAGQNTTTATFDFSAVAHNATGSICAQPTGPTCTAPATCFDIRIVATETVCNDGIDNDGDGLVDCLCRLPLLW